MASDREWKVLLEKTHEREVNAPPPYVGEIVVLKHGSTPIVARVRQILPAERDEMGTLVVEAPWPDQ